MVQVTTEQVEAPIDHPTIGTSGVYSFATIPQNPSITISAGKTHVTIKPDGTIEYGVDYTPDEAAKAFWDAMGYERKQRVP